MTIDVGTLCLVVSAPLLPYLLGRECTMDAHLEGSAFYREFGIDYRVRFKDGTLAFGSWEGRNVIPLLEPPIEITARGVRELVPA